MFKVKKTSQTNKKKMKKKYRKNESSPSKL